MTSPTTKTVALVDPFWFGHHPMYFSQFTAAFLRCEANVIGLCPAPAEAMRDLLEALGEPDDRNLAGRVHFGLLTSWSRSLLSGESGNDPIRTFFRWKHVAHALAAAEATTGLKADLVYFPYLDAYLRFLPCPWVPGLLLARPWSGLYLRNHHHGEPPSLGKSIRLLAKGDAMIRSPLCPGIGVLDERFIPDMEKTCRTSVTAFPDVTQANLPAHRSALATQIIEKAAGRKIIGIIGLERRKGFVTLLRVAGLARRQCQPFYFVCAGAFSCSHYTPAEQEYIRTVSAGIASGEIDNLHFDSQAGRIPNEADYNSIFSAFDIAWAAYEDFQGSSGTLSKAALFEIPCIASAGDCIGQRVEQYRLGLTIPQGMPDQALAAIIRLVILTDHDDPALSPRFAAYREAHSQARLDHHLAELLDDVS